MTQRIVQEIARKQTPGNPESRTFVVPVLHTRRSIVQDRVQLEVDTSRKLQATSPTHTVHTPLPAAKRARYGAEAAIRRRAAVIACWIGELRRVAQLEGIEPGLPRGFTEDREASEDGDVVLDVTRSPELAPSRGAHANILRCAT